MLTFQCLNDKIDQNWKHVSWRKKNHFSLTFSLVHIKSYVRLVFWLEKGQIIFGQSFEISAIVYYVPSSPFFHIPLHYERGYESAIRVSKIIELQQMILTFKLEEPFNLQNLSCIFLTLLNLLNLFGFGTPWTPWPPWPSAPFGLWGVSICTFSLLISL